MTTPTPLASLLRNRASLVELAIAAVGLALGVNLVASALAAYLGSTIGWMATVGVVLTAASLAIIARRTIGARRVSRSFEGFLCFRRNGSELIPIPRYKYNEELIECTSALFAENEAPRKLWDNDPVHKTFEFDPKSRTSKRRSTAAGKLVVEATEYFVLETLSTRLTDFFNLSGLDTKRLKEFTREDLGPVVFGNRFLGKVCTTLPPPS